ncbi:hypothetical protein ACP275_03G020700 [Erythranthe tilingii]
MVFFSFLTWFFHRVLFLALDFGSSRESVRMLFLSVFLPFCNGIVCDFSWSDKALLVWNVLLLHIKFGVFFLAIFLHILEVGTMHPKIVNLVQLPVLDLLML